MLRKRLGESLTARIFLITALILLCSGAITFGLIAWATPITYTAVVNGDLARQVEGLVGELADTAYEESGPLLDGFIRASGADAVLIGPDGQVADTGAQLAIQTADGGAEGEMVVTVSGDDLAVGTGSAVAWSADMTSTDDVVTVITSEQDTIAADVRFADREGTYAL